MKINFILIGLSPAPIGGYKVVYRYANDLVALGHDVAVYHCDQFGFHVPERPLPHILQGEVLRRLWRRGRPSPATPDWFELSPRVTSLTSEGLRLGDVRNADATVATACTTAEFVSALRPSVGRKFYFLQHFEDWTAGVEFVEATWRLPLTRIVIAPWLARKGRDLGVTTTLLPNAIDTREFPRGVPIADRPLLVSALVSDTPWKRTDLIIAMFHELKRRRPEVEGRTFGTCARPADLPDWVTHFQAPPQGVLKKEIYQLSRVYVCASDEEGWHLPIAEALCSGSAAASTDIEGVRAYADAIAHFSPVGNATALTNNVIGLLDDPQACERAVEDFLTRTMQYTPDDAVRALVEILES